MIGECRFIRKSIGSALLLAPILALCVRFVDVPVALYIKEHLYGNGQWSELTSDLPDLLLVVVLLTTFVALFSYLLRKRKGIVDAVTNLARVLSWATPSSYLMKTVLKYGFGRVNTRYWLEHPELYGFHWFQGLPHCEGFPSGHMLVIVTVLAAFGRFYPKIRALCLAVGILLGLALIATNYHFVSDVIAGVWLGLLIEAVTFRLLNHEPCRLPDIRSDQPAGGA